MNIHELLQNKGQSDETKAKFKYEQGLVFDEYNTAAKMILFMANHEQLLSTFQCNRYCSYVEITFNSREEMHIVRSSFGPGKWERNTSHEVLIYERLVENVNVRLICGELPPSCVIEEVEIQVEERVVPAHTEKFKRIKCTAPEEAEEVV